MSSRKSDFEKRKKKNICSLTPLFISTQFVEDAHTACLRGKAAYLDRTQDVQGECGDCLCQNENHCQLSCGDNCEFCDDDSCIAYAASFSYVKLGEVASERQCIRQTEGKDTGTLRCYELKYDEIGNPDTCTVWINGLVCNSCILDNEFEFSDLKCVIADCTNIDGESIADFCSYAFGGIFQTVVHPTVIYPDTCGYDWEALLTATASDINGDNDGSKAGVIVGILAAVAVFFALVGVIVFFLLKHRRNGGSNNPNQTPQDDVRPIIPTVPNVDGTNTIAATKETTAVSSAAGPGTVVSDLSGPGRTKKTVQITKSPDGKMTTTVTTTDEMTINKIEQVQADGTINVTETTEYN